MLLFGCAVDFQIWSLLLGSANSYKWELTDFVLQDVYS